jgi:hypothetical protein
MIFEGLLSGILAWGNSQEILDNEVWNIVGKVASNSTETPGPTYGIYVSGGGNVVAWNRLHDIYGAAG